MLIWITAIALLVLFGAIGYAKGAIRMVFPLVGLFVGLLLAVPMGPLVRPLVPLVGLTNPVWSVLIPPVIVFFLVALVFIIIGFVVHHKVSLYYKYRTDDYQRVSWERLNRGLGVAMGLFAGTVYTILLGTVVYVLGYFTVQVAAGDNDPTALRYLNNARTDLKSSGLETAAARFDPAPEKYYLASDVIGLLYHNPLLHSRLAGYPDFLALAERQEFNDLATDTEFQNMLSTRPTLGQVLNHPRLQPIISNPDILQSLLQTDLKDLREYLKTGQSTKYADLPILGRWQLDPYLTLLQQKRRKTGISTAEMRLLKQQIEFMKGYTLVATPDNNVKLKGPDLQPLLQKYMGDLKAFSQGSKRPPTVVAAPAPAAAPAAAPAQTGAPGMSDAMRQRYGTTRAGTVAPTPTPAPAPVAAVPVQQFKTPSQIAAEVAQLPHVVLAQGPWKGEGERFEINLQSAADGYRFANGTKTATVEVEIRDGKLYLNQSGEVLVLERF